MPPCRSATILPPLTPPLLAPCNPPSPPPSPSPPLLTIAEHEARQLETLGGRAPDRSRLFIGVGRAELSRAEFFQVDAGCLPAAELGGRGWGEGQAEWQRGGSAVWAAEAARAGSSGWRREGRWGCGGGGWGAWQQGSAAPSPLLACITCCTHVIQQPHSRSAAVRCPAPPPVPCRPLAAAPRRRCAAGTRRGGLHHARASVPHAGLRR
jgi:hypothetical protein